MIEDTFRADVSPCLLLISHHDEFSDLHLCSSAGLHGFTFCLLSAHSFTMAAVSIVIDSGIVIIDFSVEGNPFTSLKIGVLMLTLNYSCLP